MLSFNILGLFSIIFTFFGVKALFREQAESKNRKGFQKVGLVAQWAFGVMMVLSQIASLTGNM
jgi:hypothetical protein